VANTSNHLWTERGSGVQRRGSGLGLCWRRVKLRLELRGLMQLLRWPLRRLVVHKRCIATVVLMPTHLENNAAISTPNGRSARHVAHSTPQSGDQRESPERQTLLSQITAESQYKNRKSYNLSKASPSDEQMVNFL
jgi:hypothetical protein